MSCPKCGTPLEMEVGGDGWCPHCMEWWPSDILEDFEEEEDEIDEDDPAWDGDLGFDSCI